MNTKPHTIIYQAKNGAIELKGDLTQDTIWASLDQISSVFGRDKSVISRHIKNIYKDEELNKDAVVAFFATTAKDGKIYQVEYFNLDMILSIGYRVNSKTATRFRQWATQTLKQHITKGYSINKKVLAQNYDEFLKAIETVKTLIPVNSEVKTGEALELVKFFAETWFALDAYDKSDFPQSGLNKSQVKFTADELIQALVELKQDLYKKKMATELFGQEKQPNAIAGIVGNIFQSAFRRRTEIQNPPLRKDKINCLPLEGVPELRLEVWESGRENGSFPVEEGWETVRFHRSKSYLRRGRVDRILFLAQSTPGTPYHPYSTRGGLKKYGLNSILYYQFSCY